tara:strand:+ start:21728 stop:22879 length:1152 start_codon:yes stop_codon:yes gene_type:complete
MEKEYIEGVATYVGFVIGAGILGIPFVVAKSGYLVGLIDIILIGLIFLVLNMYLGEIVLRTKGSHQLVGYANIYLGSKGKMLMAFSVIFGMTGSLIAYIVKGGEFLQTVLAPYLGGFHIIYSLIFIIPLTILVYRGLKSVKHSEVIMVAIILFIIILFTVISLPHIEIQNLQGFNKELFFLPFGVVMFAFLGTGAVPEIREELKKKKYLMKKTIMTGALIVLAVYVIFATVVVGISGTNVTDGAVIGLGNILGPKFLVLGVIFGLLTMGTSFIAIGMALKECYMFDYKMKKTTAYLLTSLLPLGIATIIILMDIQNAFFRIIDITGIIAGGLAGFVIVPMIWKAKKFGKRKPEYTIKDNKILESAIILVFLLGVLFEFYRILF